MATTPSATPTPITPPRVALIDPRTGLISREWYMFFLSLYRAADIAIADQDVGPSAESLIASYDEALRALAQYAETLPPPIDYSTEINEIKRSSNTQPSDLTSEVQAQLNDVRQQLQTLPRPELGTFAALQQANLPWTTFDTTPQSVPDTVTGTLYWDSADRSKTLALVMEDTGQIIQDIGEETFYRVKASATITKGQVLMFTGTVGASGGLIAAPATGLSATQSEYILGVATQDIALNGWGYATWFGEIKGVDTTGGVEAWVDGEILYYNPAVAGGLTKNVPTAPNPKVLVASVVHAAANGILFVRPTFGSALGATDSNVEITGLAGGDLLQYDGVQMRWENVSSLSGIPATFLDTQFTLQDNVDPTKQAVFQLSGITTGTTRTYTLPNQTGALASIGNITQTFSGTTTFSAATVTVGSSTATSTYSLGTGATLSGNTKTVNIGTAGVSGSTTAITIGSAVSGATTTATANGTWTFQQPPRATAPVTKTADFSVVDTDLWLINNKSGSSCTVTLPTASTNTGRVLYFLNYQAQTLVSASSNVVPLAGGSAATAILEAVAGANATLVSDGTNWIMTQYDSNNALQLE